ncbi:MAG TPA: T9SS type A sorting domain-containing protein [Saprospiraceae bacterium]|nr:T9SS type A sorting domain-containing protein [Saprospiraceae bacterium]
MTENFDGFAAGVKFTQAFNNKDVWTTWSNAPGGAEDALLSDKFAVSTPNSLVLANTQDIVLLLGDKVEGRYVIEFDLLIETGKIGYYNMLNDFAGSNSVWAYQVYFNTGGKGVIDAGKASAATFDFAYNTWIHVSTIVDLDDDFATLYFDNNEIISWKWSSGTGGAGTLNKLDAINFYGNNSGGTSGMYIDNVVFKSTTAPAAPTGLKAEVIDGKDILLSWNPDPGEPDNYVLTRSGVVANAALTDTFYLDNPYPGISHYTLRSHKAGFGYSLSSESVMAEIEGGVDRKYVLFEIGTGTGCPYCPGAAMGAHDMKTNGDEVILIKYHNYNLTDPFNTAASKERAGNYYKISGYPTSFADGTLSVVGGSNTVSLFPGYHQHYLQRKERRELYSLDVHVWNLSGKTYRAEILVSELHDFVTEEKTLHTAITESDISYNWQNQTKVENALRNMYPDAFGTKLDFSDEKEHALTFDFTLGDTWVKDNLEFVVFLQADPSKEVMVATKVSLKDVLLNLDDMVGNEYAVYPNPVQSVLNVRVEGEKTFEILDITGKKMLEGITSGRIGVGQLESGMYFIRTGDGKTQKFIKQ